MILYQISDVVKNEDIYILEEQNSTYLAYNFVGGWFKIFYSCLDFLLVDFALEISYEEISNFNHLLLLSKSESNHNIINVSIGLNYILDFDFETVVNMFDRFFDLS